jgi:predicted dehydrogenase
MIRIVLTGAGFGARIQVPGLRRSGRFEVAALVGRDLERTRRVAAELDVPHAFDSLEAALGAVDCEAVSISAPPAAHAEQALLAIAAGKHVLCEKPMARDVAEAESMLAAARAAAVVALLDHEFRFHPARATLARLLRSGDLGDPRLLVAFDDLSLYVAPHRSAPAWWFDAEAGGGWLGASGSHLIDAAQVWLGPIRSVLGVVERLGAPGTADDTFTLTVDFASGARGVLHQSAAVLGPRSSALRIAGSEGTAWIDEEWRLWIARRGTEPALAPIPDDLALPALEVPRSAGPFAARELPCFVRQAEALAAAIDGRSFTDPTPATFADGLATQRVMAAARLREWTTIEAEGRSNPRAAGSLPRTAPARTGP